MYVKQQIYTFFFVLLYFVSVCTFAQQQLNTDPFFKQYSVNDGLPSNEVHDIIQDKRGYLWIATDRGISRYDGSEFVNFSTYNGLVDNSVFRFVKGDGDKIYYYTISGQIGYLIDDTFYKEPFNEQLKKLLSGRIISSLVIADDGSKFISIFYEYEVYYQITPEGSLKQIKLDGKNFSVNIKKIDDKYLTLYGEGDLLIYEEDGKRKLRKSFFPDQERSFKKTFFSYPYLYYSNENILAVWNVLNDSIEHKQFPSKILNIISVGDHIMVLTKTGNYLLRSEMLSQKGITTIFNKYAINSYLEDHSGGRWYATFTSGLFYVPPFSPNRVNLGIEGRLNYNIDVQDSTLWVSIGEMLYQINLPDYSYRTERFNKNIVNFKVVDQKLFIQLANGEVLTSESNKLRIENLDGFKDISASSNYLWIGTNTIKRVKKNGKKHFREVDKIRLDSGKINFRVENIHAMSDSAVLIGTATGLYLAKVINGRMRASSLKVNLLQNRIQQILKWKNHYIVSTLGAGILLLNEKLEVKQQFTEKNGLSSGLVNDMIKDGEYLFVATIQGVDKLKMEEQLGKLLIDSSLNRSHNLSKVNVKTLRQFDNKVYAVSNLGLLEFKTEVITQPEYELKYSIQFEYAGSSDKVWLEKVNHISHKHAPVLVRFLPVQFNAKDRVFFEYRINGDAWQNAPSEVLFSDLGPGKYVFEFRATYNKKTWYNYPKKLKVEVSPPLWKHWAFILFFSLLCALLIVYITIRVLSAKREKELLISEKEKSELKALRAQMNPHFLFNVLNSVLYLITEKKTKEAVTTIAAFARLIRKVLKYSGIEEISLEKELDFLRDYVQLERVRASREFDFEVSTGALNIENKKIPSMILQPFVENAIWHGLEPLRKRRGRISIDFKEFDDFLECRIEDNGVGRQSVNTDKEKEHESEGMKIVSERLRIVNRRLSNKKYTGYSFEMIDLKNEKGKAKGTLVILKLPNYEKFENCNY